MNNRFKKILFPIAAALVICSIPLACGNLEELTKDVEFKVNNDLIRIPLSIRFFDVSPSSTSGDPSVLIPELAIEIIGQDADKLYTPSVQRLKDINKLKGGLIDVAIKKSHVITRDRPLKFTVIARPTSGNYLPTVRSFTLTDTVKTIENIGLLNLSKTPSGVKVKTGTVTVGATGVAETTILVSDSSKVTIPKGVRFKTKEGQEVTGVVDVRLVQFSPTDPAALQAFPGGFAPQRVRDTNGSDLGSGFFQSLGFIALDMSVGGKAVKNFEGGEVTVSFDLNPKLIHPQTGKPLKAGDTVPLWSLDETTGEWKKEAIIAISNSGDKLQAVWSQSHLSYWNLDFFWNSCFVGTNIQLPANIPNGYYYMEIVDAQTGWAISAKYDYLFGGQSYTILNAPQNFNSVFVRISNNMPWNACASSNSFVSNSQTFSLCNNGAANLVFNPAPPTQVPNPTISVNVKGSCASQPNVAIGPTASIWFTEANCSNWRFLGTIVNGQFSTQELKPGTSYHFFTWTGVGAIFIADQTIPAGINSNYIYNVPTIALPQSLCSLIL